jgi:hypothetical protein
MPLPPRTPRTPLCELSPDTRSRVVSAHDYGIKICDIARQENLLPSVVLSSKTRQIKPLASHNHAAGDLLLLLYVMAEGYSEL